MMNSKDFLTVQTKKLGDLQRKSQSALDLVTSTINGLKSANAEIASTMADIREYQAMLSEKESQLDGVMKKNERIVDNFSKLIEC